MGEKREVRQVILEPEEVEEIVELERRPDGAVVVPLQYPFEMKRTKYTELVIRRPKAGDLRSLDDTTGDYSRGARLVAQLAGVTDAVVDELDAEDFARVSEVAVAQLGKYRRTGPTS